MGRENGACGVLGGRRVDVCAAPGKSQPSNISYVSIATTQISIGVPLVCVL